MRTRWPDRKIRNLSIALLTAFTLSLPFDYLAAPKVAVIRLGDYLAFHTGGLLVREGRAADLYNWQVQRSIQETWVDRSYRQFYPFAYPPHVAALFAPLSTLPPEAGKILFTLLMVLCLVLALRSAASYTEVLRGRLVEGLALFCALMPVLMGIAGAQNVSLSMLVYALTLKYLSKADKKADFTAGVILGLWLFKPQYALMMMLFLAAARLPMVLAGFLVSAAGAYLAGAAVSGFFWPARWFEAVRQFAVIDSQFSYNYPVSIAGSNLLPAAASLFGLASGNRFIHAAELALQAGLFLWLLGKFLSWKKEEDPRRRILLHDCALAAPVMLLVSLHSHFYDTGICLLAVLGYLRADTDRKLLAVLASVLAIDVLTILRPVLPFQPLLAVPAGVLLLMLRGKKAEPAKS